MRRMNRYRILVVCTGNICRSPMVEGMLRKATAEHILGIIEVSSAGTHALHGNQPSAPAVKVMQTYGIDISRHRARRLHRSMLADADLILVMERHHLGYIRPMNRFGMKKVHLITEFVADNEPFDLPDPLGGEIEQYLETARVIQACVRGIHAYIEKKHNI